MKSILLALLIALAAPVALAQVIEDPEPSVLESDPVTDDAVSPEIPDGNEDAVEEAVELLILDASTGIDPADFLWEYRIVAVLAHSPRDPAFIQQMEDIRAGADDLIERDVLVLFDSDRDSDSPLRRMLRPRGFMLAIIGKDGEIKQRRPAPRDVREIGSAIDHFPLRRQEMLDRRPPGR